MRIMISGQIALHPIQFNTEALLNSIMDQSHSVFQFMSAISVLECVIESNCKILRTNGLVKQNNLIWACYWPNDNKNSVYHLSTNSSDIYLNSLAP